MMNRKGFANIVLIVVIVAIVAVGGYFFLTREQKPVAQQTTPPPGTTQVPTPQPPSPTPTNETASLKTYTNNQYHLVFSYPADFALFTELTPTQIPSSYSINCTNPVFGTYLACLYYVGGQTSDGFEAADLEVHVNTSTMAADCTKSLPSMIAGKGSATEQKTINGTTFAYDLTGGAATGHYLSTYQYRTYQTGACYTIALNVASNRGQSEKGLSNEFSNMMLAKLQSVLSTFKFTK